MGLQEVVGFVALGTLLTIGVFLGLLLCCIAYVVLVVLLEIVCGVCDRYQRGRRHRIDSGDTGCNRHQRCQ